MLEIKGICPIIATPFRENGEVDYESMENLIKTLIQNGCHGVTLFGIAGEYYKLCDEERKKMALLTVKICKENGGTSIISVTDHATEIAVKNAIIFEEIGADCLMLLPPFFLKRGGDALYEHMKEVAQSVRIPVMVQYAPEQTGVAIAPSVFEKLTNECQNILYYKIECKPAGPYISNLLKLTEDKVKIFVGNAGFQLIEALDRGAVGVMPGCSMFDVYLDIYQKYKLGNRNEAIDLQNQLLPILNHIRQNVEQIISFEKRILKRRGIIKTEYCRKPSYPTDAYFDELFDEYYEPLAQKYSW